MKREEDIASLVDELNQETGLDFSLKETGDDPKKTAKILTKLIHRYKGTENSGFFLKQFLLGEIREEEIEEKRVLYHFDTDTCWTVILLTFKQSYEPYMLRMISSLYVPGADRTVEMDPNHLVLVRQLKKEISQDELKEMAQIIVDTLGTEALISVKASYDRCYSDFKELPQSYRNVCSADAIGNLFLESENVYGYHNLGLGKLIYTMPKDKCQEFLQDHLGDFDLSEIDSETRNTIKVFFDCGLSLAETARVLYLHRNTLVYRIEKIEKQCGLDIRKFDDAIIMKIALMMYDYIRK
ncbi:MAG TPA: hypothetical protein DCQ87_02330 [Lachnospiraceae bacterium]|nr:helix-turn-helix domain-containing protein [Lachnospiraceae bacterium]MDD7664600.1 helix-turn-helix domain-containing protein [Lachnospiraceae bacterium]MDY4165360.1 helix-turn-helix domain-containing protein [Lachnospiraceae bacterium]HAP02857.1 hypothetical protein [Lachnospiraceae bacterium]